MRTLHVVTHRRWVADDLATGAFPGLDVRHHLGLDLPDFAPGDGVWAPMEWMARAVAVDPRLHLIDPGAALLTLLPRHLLGRDIRLLTRAQMEAEADEHIAAHGPLVDGPPYFAKPANCKVEEFPARWDDLEGHVLGAIATRIPADQPFLLTTTRLDIVEEHRLFVLDGAVVTSSPYRALDLGPEGHRSETLWHEEMTSECTGDAEAFGAHVLAALEDLPRSFALDVAVLADGTWVVIEANPVWSSAFYGADPAQVVRCLLVASRVADPAEASAPEPHRWVLDPYLIQRVARQRPLPRR